MNKTALDLSQSREAARRLAVTSPRLLADCLRTLAELLRGASAGILAANALDLERMDPEDPKYDRLLLDSDRLNAIAGDVERVAALPCPLGQELECRTLDNGLVLRKVRVPLGVVGVVFESRPNVTVDVAALCLASGNAVVLKGSRDAADSNRALVNIIHQALDRHGLPSASVTLADAGREALAPLLAAVGQVDVVIPRGSQGLIDHVRETARVPVIETGAGIVHVYVHQSADLSRARDIVTNSKARRVSVCNALDTLLIDEALLPSLADILEPLGNRHQAEVFADAACHEALKGRYSGPLHEASEADFGREFLAMKLAVAAVADLDDALAHIAAHSSGHSEAIVAEDSDVIDRYLGAVDAAAVYANASTAFTDGGQFGMGAEIGISTQKLHARGPMALPELTSYKWLVTGSGQVRT